MKQEIQTKIEPSTNLGILVGMLLTDGSVSKHGGHKTISFTCKSEELHEIFKEKMKKLFGKEKFGEWLDKRWDGVKTTWVHSTKIFEQLHQLTPTFRTKPFEDGSSPPAKVPDFIFSLPEASIKEILKVMFSTDGSICLGVTWSKSDKMWQIRRIVKLSSLHSVIKEQVSRLLSKLQIQHKVKEDGIVIWKKSEIVKFRSLVGFVDGVKVTRNSKHWTGFEKMQILDLSIKTFDLKKRDLQKFETKEEIISFLKSFLMAPVITSAS